MKYEIDATGRFIADMVFPEPGKLWTSDPPPQPVGRPQYVGFSIDEATCECYGGSWVDLGDDPPADPREVFKYQRATAVASIKVTTSSGNVFDGDEVSQNRMIRALVGLSKQPEGTTIPWVLADNSVTQVDASELEEALALASLEQASMWVPSADPMP